MTLLLSALAAIAAAAGCSPADNDAANGAAPGAALEEQGYQLAPELTGVAPVGPDGRIMLSGQAGPAAVVRLATPAGEAVFATADRRGAWRVAVPGAAAPRLFSLSMSDNGRIVQAMGYLFVTPDGVVARLRAGGGSEVLAAKPGMAALALDYDSRQAATMSGVAAAGEAESLRVDGVERGQATTDASGRFVLPVSEPLSAGSHDFDLAGAKSEVRFSAAIDTPRPLASQPFAVSQLPQGWRVDWLTPGGGEQTTLVFDALAPAT